MTRKPPAHYRRVFFVPSLPIWYSDWYSLFGTGLVQFLAVVSPCPVRIYEWRIGDLNP